MGLGKTYSTKYLADSNNNTGAAGQVLISTSTGINWSDANTIGNGPYLPLAGGTMSGTAGVLMPDNFKLNLGTSSDLQIYHDGSDSYIDDTGTGWLRLRGNGGVILSSYSEGETMLQATRNGAVYLYYDNSKKFETTNTGVTVTGSLVVSNDITATGDLDVRDIDARDGIFTGNVGIGTTNPSFPLHVNTSNDVVGYFKSTDNKASIIIADNDTTGYVSAENDRVSIGYGNGASTANITIVNGSYNVGIGTTSPTRKLEVYNGSSSMISQFRSGSGTSSFICFANTGSIADQVRIGSISTNLVLSTNYTERMRIDSSGNVGIGTTSTNASLHVASTTSDFVAKFSHSTASGYAPGSILLEAEQSVSRGQGIFHYNSVADENWFTGVPYSVSSKKWIVANKYSTVQAVDTAQLSHALLTIDSDTGNVGIGTTSPDAKLEVQGVISSADAGLQKATFANVGNDLVLTANADATNVTAKMLFNSSGAGGGAVSTKMIIDGSGNVGIGTTSPNGKLQFSNDVETRKIVLWEGYDNDYQFYGFGVESSTLVYTTYGAGDDHVFFVGASATSRNELMRIKSTGKVGIGTDDPDSLLHIKGADPVFIIQDNSTGTANASSTLRLGESGSGGVLDVYWDIKQAADDLNTHLEINHSANGNHLTILDSGNVGIGTTSPSSLLSVGNAATYDNPSTTVNIATTDTGSYLLKVTSDQFNADGNWVGIGLGYSNNYMKMGIIAEAKDSNARGKLHFAVNTAAGSSNASISDAKMTIDNAGNVGIGTTSPASSLNITTTKTVALSSAADFLTLGLTVDDLTAGNTAGGGGGIAFRSKNTNAGTQIVFGAIDAIKESANVSDFKGSLRFFTNQNSTGIPLERMRIDSDGNVGIGTTSPTDMLDVNGTSIFRRDLTIYHKGNNSAPSYELRFKGTNSSGVDKIQASLESSPYTTDTNAGTLLFKTANASNQILDTRMVIDGVGNVGIGTTSPGYTLDVNGSMHSTDITIANSIYHEGDTNTYMQFHSNDQWRVVTAGSERLEVNNTQVTVANSLQVNSSIYASQYIYHTGDTNTYMRFPSNDTISWNTAGSERMRINSSGNIGIGTTAPTYKLHVAGTTYANGSTIGSSDLLLKDTASAYSTELKMQNNTHTIGIDYQNNEQLRFITRSGTTTVPITFQMRAGTITAANFILSSDERKKTKIVDLTCDNVDVSWKSFEMKDNEGEYRTGVIAQELEQKHPEFVNTDEEGFKTVKYIDLLIAKIAELEARLEKVENN